MQIRERVFLVGCPRSGTTILQAAIAAHPKITTFPEAAFFRQAVGRFRERFGYYRGKEPPAGWPSALGPVWSRWTRVEEFVLDQLRPAGMAHPSATACVVRFLEQVNRADLIRLYPRKTLALKPKIEGFINILDQLAIERGKDTWLEKTPSHVLYLDVIEEHVPTAKFIHLIRHGPDVVASLADALASHESWRAANPGLAGVENMVRLWNRCYNRSRRCKPLENHCLVSYENLLRDPEPVLRKICHFLGLGFQPSMLLPKGAGLWTIGAMGPAKRGVGKGIKAPDEKFTTIFSPAEQQFILAKLKTETMNLDVGHGRRSSPDRDVS